MSNNLKDRIEKMHKRDKKLDKKAKRKRFFISLFIYSLLVVILILVIFSDKWFGESSWLAERKSGLNAVNNYFKSNSTLIFDTILYSIIILVISKIVRFVLNVFQSRLKKGKAVINLLCSFIKYTTGLIILILLLKMFGIDTTTLITSIGILGLIIGLGAQSLIEDIISGLFIVFEKIYDVGDVVVFDGFRGTIQEIGLRTTKIVDIGGDLLTINNSDIRRIINMTSDLSIAICDVSIEYGESLERVENIIKKNLDKFKLEIPTIIQGPNYLGVKALAESGVVLRLTAKCNEKDRYQVVRDLNREIKLLFDKNNITIPFPQVVVNKPKNSK